MAILLEYCSVIVPIQTITEKLGEDAFEKYYALHTESTWYDQYLYREGCMNHTDLSDMLDSWEEQGFQIIEQRDGLKYWKDVCVANSGHGPSYPCDWLEYDKNRNIVWLKGTEPGNTSGPPG